MRRLHDIPACGAPVELVWRQRRRSCAEEACPVDGFSEDTAMTRPRSKLTVPAAWWAIGCLQRDTASVASVTRRLGVDWHTVWSAIEPLLSELADDPARLDGVTTLGVDEHIWHLADGKKIADQVIASFPSCPIPEIARLGRTLRAWREAFLAYFTTDRANNGGTEAINGIIELHRRIARGFRNQSNYRLRMILAAGRLTHSQLR